MSTGERIRDLLARPDAGGRVTVRGWLKTARHGKERSFLEVSDGSCLSGIQVLAEPSIEGYAQRIRSLRVGAAVRVEGELVESPGRGQRFEIHAHRVDVVGATDEDYPLQKKRHSFEFLRTIAHLRLRTNALGAVMRVRNEAAQAIHAFFQERGFVELHAPVISTSDCEGAGELFRVTTLDLGRVPREPDESVRWREDFFGRPAYLTVSGQLEAEIGAHALGRVYTFGPTFRAENSNTSRHLAEFWMVEPEVAFLELEGNAALAEQFVRSVVRRVLDRCEEDLRLFDERIDPGLLDRLAHVAESTFERLTYGEAIEILERSGRAFEFPVQWGLDLQSEHERFLAEEHVGRPLVLTHYPRAIKPFYMYVDDEDPRTVRAMDVLVPRIGEIVGGSQREHRLDVLAQRMEECGLPAEEYWWYLDLRRHGPIPHSGFGLGFERLVQLLTGMSNIRDVIPFPRTPGSADF